MTVEFHLPDVGEGLHEAEILQWLVKVGEPVARNQPVVEILTDKSAVELPAPAAGTLTHQGAAVGDMLTVGDLLLRIDNSDGAAPAVPKPVAVTPPPPEVAPEVTNAPPPLATAPTAGPSAPTLRPKASPSTRKLAASRGIDLGSIAGTGPGGRILAEDLDQGPPPPPQAPPIPTTIASTAPIARPASPAPTLGQAEPGVQPLRGVRRATAKAMDLSWSTIPHMAAMSEIDATALLEARQGIKTALGDAGANVKPLTLLMMAVARALKAYPLMNATLDLDAETITVHPDINIGVAVASDNGLIVAVVKNADRLNVQQMADEIARLSTAARSRRISNEDLSGGTFTVTNYGSHGGHYAFPIIRPGETGIVGFGAIEPRPWVVDDAVVPRPVLPIVLTADHRLIDGDLASAFRDHVGASLANPISLVL